MPVILQGTGKRLLSREHYLKLPADQEEILPVMNLHQKNPFPIDFSVQQDVFPDFSAAEQLHVQ